MREIGVRQLKASLSEVLHEAQRGERIRVTSHGRPLADIVAPASDTADDWLFRLEAEGRVTRATRARPTQAPRLVHAPRSASELVLEDRDAER